MEKFEIRWLIPTVIVGVVVGVWAAIAEKAPRDFITAIEASPLFAAITFGAEALLKALWRNTVPLFRDLWGALKSGSDKPVKPQDRP